MTCLLKLANNLRKTFVSLPCHTERGTSERIYGRRFKEITMNTYWVYMMQSANGRALYTGVTNDLVRRVGEHKEGKGSLFISKYKCHKLVYYEDFGLIDQAIEREKKIKKLSRANKEKLIDKLNPNRVDLLEQ